MIVDDIVARALTTLKDLTQIQYKDSDFIMWVNDACRAIVAVKPSANAKIATVSLAAGVHQNTADTGSINLPSCVAIIDVRRNKATTSDKRPISRVDMKAMDEMSPAWASATASVNIKHWMHDKALPKRFDVYPPAASGAQVEIVYGDLPTACTAVADNLPLPDEYANPIYDYVIYRALVNEADSAINSSVADKHLATFTAYLSLGE